MIFVLLSGDDASALDFMQLGGHGGYFRYG